MKTQRTAGPEDHGTREPGDQRTTGPEDHGTRGPRDQRTRRPKDRGTRGPETTGPRTTGPRTRRPQGHGLGQTFQKPNLGQTFQKKNQDPNHPFSRKPWSCVQPHPSIIARAAKCKTPLCPLRRLSMLEVSLTQASICKARAGGICMLSVEFPAQARRDSNLVDIAKRGYAAPLFQAQGHENNQPA